MANTQIKITISEETLKRLTEDGLGKPSFGLAIWAKRLAELDAQGTAKSGIVVERAEAPEAKPAQAPTVTQINAAAWE